jgi:DHA3 family macrolide efflux protein-like MFS transporter
MGVKKLSGWKVTFGAIWVGQIFSLVGSSISGFALAWWLTELTGSATVLATAYMVELLPGVILGPFAGALVDRWNRRKVMIGADLLVALLSLGLALLSWAGLLKIWHVYVLMLLRALGGTFHWPAMSASTSLLVPKEHLSRVAGLNQMVQGAQNIISPALGALLLTLLPLHGIMGIDVVTALIAVIPLLFVHIPQPQAAAASADGDAEGAQAASPMRALLSDVREGLRFVWGWKGMCIVLGLAMLVNFMLNPAFTLMPLLVKQEFGRGALELGWMQSGWGLGVVVGGLVLGVWGGFRRRAFTSMLGIAGIGMGTLLVGLVPTHVFMLAVAGMGLTGLMNPIANGPFFATIQELVPPAMQGRVLSLVFSLCSAVSPLAMLVAGPLADAFGVRLWYVMGGVTCIVAAVFGRFSPAVLRLEEEGAELREAEGVVAPATATPVVDGV